jgi:hypothetical protein
MGSVPESEFGRLAIAYGLSIPLGEGAEFLLPSQFQEMQVPVGKREVVATPYEDTKDLC